MITATPAISLAGVSFSYGDTVVLRGIDLTIPVGEFLGIIGPNGGGKSTLLKLILGLLAPQTGQIRVLGRHPRQARRAIGYVPQYPGFSRDFPISVEQAVLLGRLHRGLAIGGYRREDRIKARTTLAEVAAEAFSAAPIGSLSGGQLQRVLLARALVGDPQILVLDEPTANIDQRLEGDIFTLLKGLNRRMTILVVSHDVGFISSYVGRVACLNGDLVCHRTDALDGAAIQALYGGAVRMVAHHHCYHHHCYHHHCYS